VKAWRHPTRPQPPLDRAPRRRRGPRPAPRCALRGLTLIEVLVALAIVATALATGLKAAAALAGNAERLGDTLAAQWCAENQLTNLRLAHQFPPVGDSDFSCEQLGRSYRGHLVVRNTPNPNFNRVDAVLDDERGYPLLRLSTVVSRF
jgi:general secretion pathway protein I